MLTDEQKEIRKRGVSGSEIGAVAGLNPHMSPLDVWLLKTGKTDTFEENDDIRRGRHLEDGIARWWAEEREATDVTEPGTLVSSEHPLMIATPDRAAKVRGVPLALEIKAPRRTTRGWGPPGTNQVPAHYLAQCHWEMGVLDVELCEVAALINDELCIYPIERNEEFEGLLLERAEKFWKDHVLTGIPPEASASDGKALTRLFPRNLNPNPVDYRALTPEEQRTIDAYRGVRSQFAAIGEMHDALQNRVKQIIGTSIGMTTPFGDISWRANRPSQSTDHKSALISFRQTLQLHASADPKFLTLLESFESTLSENTKSKEGARPFIVRFEETHGNGNH